MAHCHYLQHCEGQISNLKTDSINTYKLPTQHELNVSVLQLGNVVCPLQWPPEGGLILAPDRQLRGGHVPVTPPRQRGSFSFSSCDAEGCGRSPLAHLPMVAEGEKQTQISILPYLILPYTHYY